MYVEDVQRHQKVAALSETLLQEGRKSWFKVVKEPFGTKGARVTTQLTFPGRYVVFLPHLNSIGVSRRIKSEKERDRLKKLAEDVRIPKMGLIVRTVAEGISKEEMARDVRELYGLWKMVQEKAERKSAPVLIHQELELVSWVLRDLFGDDVDRLLK